MTYLLRDVFDHGIIHGTAQNATIRLYQNSVLCSTPRSAFVDRTGGSSPPARLIVCDGVLWSIYLELVHGRELEPYILDFFDMMDIAEHR